MELKRILGRLAPRWPMLIIAGLIGAIAAFIFVQQRNSEVEPVYRADASVTIIVGEDEDPRGASGAVADELAVALELAQTVNEDELRRDDRFVTADGATDTLVFGAIDATEEAALVAATSMRSAYVDADPQFDVNAELAAKLSEAEVISAELERLVPDQPVPTLPTPEEAAAAEAHLTILQAQEAALNAKISELNDLKIDSEDSGEIAGIDADLAELQESLAALLVVLRPLEDQAAADAEAAAPAPEVGTVTTPEIDPDLPIEEQWAIMALSGRLTTLQTESADLIVASVTGADIDLPDATVLDESPSVTPTWMGLLVGFLAGALIWSAILLAFDRMRGIIWQPGDVKGVAVLAEGPAVGLERDDLTDLERHRRKRSVQAIRSAIIGAGRLGDGTIVGFSAPPSTDPDVRDDLARDVAASVAAVGRKVLMVDLGFTGSVTYGPTNDRSGLRRLFDSVGGGEEAIRELATDAIHSAERVSPGLDVLTADSDVIDPADILAGRPLTELLNQARQRYDIVVVIQPSTTVNAGAGVDAYLQQQVIVCTRGRTRVSEISSVAIATNAAHVQLVGVAILLPESVERSRRSDEVYGEPEGRGARKGSPIKKIGGNDRPASDVSVDRIRSLESYSVEESALLQSSEPTERT